MADNELGVLRRPPRIPEHRAMKAARYRTEGMAGGAFDATVPVDQTDEISIFGDNSGDGNGATPDWFAESFSLTSGSGSTITLTNYPVQYSEIVRLNGITLAEGTDYTVSGNVITWVNLTDLRLGIGSDTWTVDVTYPYFDVASPPDPITDFMVAGDGTLTLPRAVTGDDIAILAIVGNATTVSGGWATWTRVYDSTAATNDHEIDLYIGTGGGVGTTITVSGGSGGTPINSAVVACYTNMTGKTVALRNTTLSGYLPQNVPNPIAAANATAVVGDIAFSTVMCLADFVSSCYPDATSTYVETGFVGTRAVATHPLSVSHGIAATTGIATATSVGASFGVIVSPGSPAGDGQATAYNFTLSVT